MQILDINGLKISKRQLNQRFHTAKSKHENILEQIENGKYEKVWEYFDNLIEFNYYRTLNDHPNEFFKTEQ